MGREVLLAQPIHQLASLCLTVGYYPSYEQEFYAREIENVVVPEFMLDKFIEQANYVFGMDEFPSEEEFETESNEVYKLLTKWKPGMCPHILSAFYVDEMGKIKIVASGLPIEESIQWAVPKGW